MNSINVKKVKTAAICILLAAAILAAGVGFVRDWQENHCLRCERAGSLKGYSSMQIIRDRNFEQGIVIMSQKDHANGNKVTNLGTHSFSGGTADSPVWKLAQWDSGPDLFANMVDEGDGSITDGKWRKFNYDPNTDTMTFRLNTAAFYEGRSAVTGEYWPHLLIECPDFGFSKMSSAEKAYLRCDADRIIASFDVCLTDYSLTENPEDWVEAAQFLLYFYVKGIETNDFCWFGLQLFDNRCELNGTYVAMDGGKSDASHKLIYSIGSMYLFKEGNTLWKNGAPNPDGHWVHVEADLKPFLEDMLERGLGMDYFAADSLDEFYIGGMNLGWETIATFDTTMKVRNFQLNSYLAEEKP